MDPSSYIHLASLLFGIMASAVGVTVWITVQLRALEGRLGEKIDRLNEKVAHVEKDQVRDDERLKALEKPRLRAV